MTSIKRTFRWFAIILSILLFGALIIPFATRMSQANEQTMTLTPGDTLTINCDTELDTDIQGNQVSLKCAPLPAEPIATGFDGLTNGQSVSGMVNVEALTEGENIHQVKFTLQGPKEIEHVEYHAPFFLFGDSNGNPKGWDTTEYPDGEYRLIARATNEQGQGKSTTIVVRIDNGTQTAPADSETDAPITVSAQESPVNNNGKIMVIPGRIEAEHYRKGGQNTGYLDKSRGNQGDSNYRNDDVDIRNCDSNGDGQKKERCVGWWEGDEWLAYQVDIQASGKYVFRVRGAADHNNAKLELRIGDNKVGEVRLRDTGSAAKFDISTSDQIQLPEGRHLLRIKQASGHSFDIDAINVERAGGSEPQPTQAPPRDDSRLVQIPGTFEVENYRDGGRDQGYYDKSRGNKGDSNYRNDDVDIRNCGGDEDGRCVGWWEGDEWLAYNVDIQASGKYTFRVRGATSRDDAKIQFRIDDTAVGSVTLKNTGGANSFATSTSEAIQLPKGRHTLKIKQVGGHSFDLNAINVERAGDGGGNPPAPTNEPQPTNEPVPTNEPQPTNEPVPTNEPQPTNEPEPTVAPPPTDTGRSGRGEGANIYLNKQEIDSIREKVRSGQGPWQNYYDRLMDDARDALSAGPYSVTRNGVPDGEHSYFTEAPYCGWKRVDGKDPDCRDGQINPQANRADYDASIAVGRDVRTLGLAYVLSGEERYAERAAYLINVWAVNSDSRMNPRFTNGQSRIELSITMPGLFYGADLISESSSWSNNDQRAFRSWANDFVDSGKAWTGENNFEAWRLVFVASGAAYTNDRSDLNYVYDRFKAIMPEHIGSEGQMVKELGRTKSLMYSLYSLNAFTQIAEIARHNGENLYDYSRNGRNLKLALDYHVLYSINPDRWQRQQIAPIESKDVAHYEFAYRHYGDSDYLRVVNEWGRPLNEARTMGPVTLTHGR